MLKQSSVLKAILATVTAIGLGCSAFAASETNLLQQILRAAPNEGATPGAATPAQVLPALSNPKPYRQGVQTTCNVSNPALGSDACVIKLDQVPSGHLLQIDKISCIVNNGTAILFNTQIKVDGAHIFGFVLPPLTGGGTGGLASGPYYFKAGETPKLGASGSSPTDIAICATFGTLWQTN